MPTSLFAKLLESILTRDGLWAAICVVLMSCIGYLYFGEIKAMRAQLNRVEFKQMRDCIRSLKPKTDPAVCWTDPPNDVIEKALAR